MTPHDVVMQHYTFPYELRGFQVEDLNESGDLQRFGCYADPGLGKTAYAIAVAGYRRATQGIKHHIVTVPPIVFNSWGRSLEAIIDNATGKHMTYLYYRGTPKQREALRPRFKEVDFIIMTTQILKNDFDKIAVFVEEYSPGFIIDEAHCLKNYKSDTHKAVQQMSIGLTVTLLTGSPTGKPEDCYGLMRFTNPTAYRNYNQFVRAHVSDEDTYGNPKEYKDLGILNKNFLTNAVRRYKRDHLQDLPPLQIIPMFYDMEPAHLKLYNKLAEAKLLELENGVVDALSTSRLTHALQQIVVNYGHFASDESKDAAALQILDEVLDEIGDEKLVVVGVYRLTNDLISKKYAHMGCATIYGGMTQTQRDEAVRRFTNDKDCRILVIQPQAGGVGIDGLQHVCSEMLFLECPSTPKDFWQVTARLDRSGQTQPVNCRIAVANKTLQVRRHKSLLDNDEMVVRLEGGTKDLRKMIYGE